MINSFRHRKLAVLLFAAILVGLFFPLWVHAEGTSPVSFRLDFETPLEIPLNHPYHSKEGKEELSHAIKSITQPVFDALIRDDPLAVMWMDILGCNLNSSLYPYTDHVAVSSFSCDIALLPSYVDPKGMTEQVNDVLDAFTPSGDTMYERVKSIHDFVCLMTEYDAASPYLYSAYGSLVYRRAVCEGYAEAFKLLCDRNGIDCVLISGVAGSEDENHMWTYVRMDDDRWYAVDPTWDDGRGTALDHNYFLVGSETVLGNGTAFADSHRAKGDISATGYFHFSYPELTVNSYLTNHPDGVAGGDYVSGEGEGYFFKQLTNTEQRAFYAALRGALTDKAPSLPNATPTPAPTDDMVTTGPETTSSHTPTPVESSSDQESDTVTQTETTVDDTTAVTTEPPTPTETAFKETSDTSLEVTTVPQTTTETDVSSALTTQSPQTTVPLSESLPQSTPAPAVSQSETLPPIESDSHAALSSEDTSATVGITVTPPPSSTPQGSSVLSLLDTLRVIVIVLALLTVFVLVCIVLIKTQNSERK